MLYFIAVSQRRRFGFVTASNLLTYDVRYAQTFDSFAAADTAAKSRGYTCYAILSNCIG